MLPIQIQQFTPENWRSLEKQLIAIAAKEKLKLEPRDRSVCKVLPLVQHSAKSQRWTEVFEALQSRGIVALEVVAIANTRAVSPLEMLASKYMAYCFQSLEPPAKLPNPPKPPKTKPFLNKYRSKYKPASYWLLLGFLRWISAEGIKHQLSKMYFLLAHTHNGFLRLVSKSQAGFKVTDLLKKLGTKNKRKRKTFSTKIKGRAISEAIEQILTDKLQDTFSLYTKFCQLIKNPMTRSQFDDRLKYRAKKGSVYYYNNPRNRMAFYSTVETDLFESKWISLGDAYAIAVSNGCIASLNTFRNHAFDGELNTVNIMNYYSNYGLDFRVEAPKDENRFLKWRALN